MKRNIMKLFFVLTGLSLFLFGCSGNALNFLADKESKEAKKFEISKALDKHDYKGVIYKLENDSSYQSVFSTDERNMNLAAAYLGEAGFDIPSLVKDMVSTINSTSSGGGGTGGSSSFDSFMKVIQNKASGLGLYNISQANDKYSSIINTAGLTANDCKNTASLGNMTDFQKDACFNSSLLKTTQGAMGISLLVGTYDSWKNPGVCGDLNQNTISDDADATSCATQYAISNSASACPQKTSGPVTVIFNGVASGGIPTPLSLNAIEITYPIPTPTPSNMTGCSSDTTYTIYKPFYIKLISNSTGIGTASPVITTQDYCDVNFKKSPDSSCDSSYVPKKPLSSNTCWPCPVLSATGAPMTVTDTIVTSLNTGLDAILALVPPDQQSAVSDAIGQYKQNLCGTATCTIDASIIASFMQTQ